ncbi:hypothetical protein BS333_01890 [Vibrio azureus]|uniref:DUF481 domain-containing protein n=1 Tax=Vibrio azureus NBRC 104587 TaxID=1219077 RepID=U3CB41_9VIBR|nr:DUF481 domain-containing protein [Vibrio azureus]AUI85239.1 hypothetical protein BS333_01890 [Vibrio azureus]GAD75603.1 hypothetical protein VAZ01S_027_00310 [Vibrio azureus NBRC 104587]
MNKKWFVLCVSVVFGNHYVLADSEKTTQQKSQVVWIDNNDDWLQLKSGEVIKGELTGTIKEEANSLEQEIEFDSDDLGDQDIEIKDIAVLETVSFFTVRVANGEIYDGYLSIKNDKLFLHNDGEEWSFPIEQVVSIYRGREEESDHWKTELFLGLDISKGNTEEFSLLGEIETERLAVDSRTKLKARHENSRSDSTTTAKNTSFDGSYDIYLSNKLFFRPLKLSVLSDEFQNIDHKEDVSMQLGYFILANPRTQWDVSLGPGYQYTAFRTVEAGEKDKVSSSALYFESNFEYELTRNIDLTYFYSFSWTSKENMGTQHKNELGIDIDLVKDLDLSIKATWEHVSDVEPNADGITPKEDDYTFHFGLTYEI